MFLRFLSMYFQTKADTYIIKGGYGNNNINRTGGEVGDRTKENCPSKRDRQRKGYSSNRIQVGLH